MWESYLFCLRGDTLIVYDSGKYKYVWQIQVCFDVSNLGGELVCIFVVFLFICLSFHTCGDVFVECFRKGRYILFKTFYLLLATSWLGILD